MRATNIGLWLAPALIITLVLGSAAPVEAEEGYVPASSGKRFTPTRGPDLRVIAGISVGVPIFLDTDTDVVRPGGDIYGWVGLDIGWMVFGAGFGVSWNAVDLSNVEGADGLGRSPLSRIYVAPELRFQVPKAEAVLPYLSGSFDMSWWRHREVTVQGCNLWYCLDRSSYTFAPGFTAKLGLAIKIGKRVYLDLGSKFSLTGAGDFFPTTETFVTPYLGVIYRGDPS